jgi:hypothetical protein
MATKTMADVGTGEVVEEENPTMLGWRPCVIILRGGGERRISGRVDVVAIPVLGFGHGLLAMRAIISMINPPSPREYIWARHHNGMRPCLLLWGEATVGE